MAKFEFRTDTDTGEVCLSINDTPFPGVYDSEQTARRIGTDMDAERVEKAFSYIYTEDGQERPITMADYVIYLDTLMIGENYDE